MLVGQYMTRNVITVGPDTSHRTALDLMREKNIRRLPVVQGNRLVGIVSLEDLLSTAPSPATTLSMYEIVSLLDQLKVSQIMVHPVITVGPECPLQDAAQIMLENRVGCLPIMQGGEVAGIITETDIMRVLVILLGGGQPGMNLTLRIKDEPGALANVANAIAQAGGNIVAINALPAQGKSGMIAIKEQGADEWTLRGNLKDVGAEIVDIQQAPPHQPVMYG